VAWELLKEDVRHKLGHLAVDESNIGHAEDKVNKIKNKTLGTLWDMRNAKTCGLIEEDKALGIRKYAKPIGVIANVVPCTNPESTICCLALSTLKTRNAQIVSPHPRTQKTSYETVQHVRKALEKIGAPVDLVQCIKKTSHARTAELMANCDFAVATGGAALVEVVYRAGKPAQTVGAGNVVSIVDDSVDLAEAAHKIRLSKIANNSASCSSENAVALYESIYDEMIAALKSEGGYLCSTDEREQLRQYMWPDGTHLNRDIVARPATFIAEKAGLKVPEGTRFLMVIGEKVGPEDRFSGEKISPVLTVFPVKAIPFPCTLKMMSAALNSLCGPTWGGWSATCRMPMPTAAAGPPVCPPPIRSGAAVGPATSSVATSTGKTFSTIRCFQFPKKSISPLRKSCVQII
jgi:sulfoacetaldehyde dehydrogenase